MSFRVGQTIECMAGIHGGWLIAGHRYQVVAVYAFDLVAVKDLTTGICDGGRYDERRFRAVPSLIDPDKWTRRHAVSAQAAGWSYSMDALAAWCLVNSAATLLCALVDALPSKPARTWDDYPLWSVWRAPNGQTWTVHRIGVPSFGDVAQVLSMQTAALVTLDQMADWVCLSMPVAEA